MKIFFQWNMYLDMLCFSLIPVMDLCRLSLKITNFIGWPVFVGIWVMNIRMVVLYVMFTDHFIVAAGETGGGDAGEVAGRVAL